MRRAQVQAARNVANNQEMAGTLGQGVEPHQFLKGTPLFGDETDEVLTLVAERARRGWNR